MFCTSCGAQMPVNAIKCPQCGTSMGAAAATAALSAAAQSGALKGFFVLLVSFFTMPLKTLRLTVQQLREVGESGVVGIGSSALPHFSWLRVAQNLLVSIVIAVILLTGIVSGLMSLKQLQYSVSGAIGGLIWKPVLALLVAVAADWVVGLILEMIYCIVVISDDVHKIASRTG